jgi:hypothetical protein
VQIARVRGRTGMGPIIYEKLGITAEAVAERVMKAPGKE